MVISKLRDFLDSHNVKYVVISHSLAFSAQEVAAMLHIPGREMAKTVIVNVGGKLAMAVLPASFNINFQRLMLAMGTGDAYLAPEAEFQELFPDCELGAMPPFGNLYGMDVYVAESLAEDDEIAFNAGSHTDLVKLSYADFAQLVKPKVLSFTNRFDKRRKRRRIYA
jgi:Ala-tRNA(Pro) deacylase